VTFAIELSRDAAKTLDRVDEATRRRIEKKLDELGVDPFTKSKPLSGVDHLRSGRVGGWRLILIIDRGIKVIRITAILPRGQAYRGDHMRR